MKRLLLFLLLAACTSTRQSPSISKLMPLGEFQSEKLIFPLGHYRHAVKLHIPKAEDGKPKDFSFEGIVETSAEKINLVMLSPFHTTIMKIHENVKTGEVNVEAFEERIKKFQSKFIEYYARIRKIFVLEKGQIAPQGVKIGEPATPRIIDIEDPHFHLNIKVYPMDKK